MPYSELHKKKRKKNRTILAAILIWCLVIFLVSIIRMAQAGEISSEDAFLRQRAMHNQGMKMYNDIWNEEYQAREAQRKQTEEVRDQNREAHRRHTELSTESWHRKKTLLMSFEQLIEQGRDQQRQRHLDNTINNPEQWWDERAQRHQDSPPAR